ncbi:MAG: PilZ domain-containing protein, partial [Pyrinomonadaceae bacterium]
MDISDRRSGSERRTNKRFSVNIDVEWEGSVGRQPGTISDVSTTGCFVLCSGEV